MTSGFDSAINSMVAELRQQWERLGRLQESARQLSGSATSPRHHVTVTVDSRGTLTGIKFNDNSYRSMAPEELASLIVETGRAAQRDARRATYHHVGDIGVSEEDFDALADGTMQWQSTFRDSFTLPQALLDLLGTTPEDLLSARGYPGVRQRVQDARSNSQGDWQAASGGGARP